MSEISDVSDNNANEEGQRRIARYEAAVERKRRAEREKNSAECEVSNATNHLARWLAPDDLKRGEEIGVWLGSKIYTVKKTMDGPPSLGSFSITIRESRARKESGE